MKKSVPFTASRGLSYGSVRSVWKPKKLLHLYAGKESTSLTALLSPVLTVAESSNEPLKTSVGLALFVFTVERPNYGRDMRSVKMPQVEKNAQDGISIKKPPKLRLKRKIGLNRGGVTSSSTLKKELWQLCRKIIKKRHPPVCYTCGAILIDGTSNFQIGHFIPSSVCSAAMRYDLDNLRPQCSACNIWKSGNWPAFEDHLRRDGIDPEILKDRNIKSKGKQYDSLWYKNKIEEYKKLSTL